MALFFSAASRASRAVSPEAMTVTSSSASATHFPRYSSNKGVRSIGFAICHQCTSKPRDVHVNALTLAIFIVV